MAFIYDIIIIQLFKSDQNIFFHMPILLGIKSREFNVRLDKPLPSIFNKYSNVI